MQAGISPSSNERPEAVRTTFLPQFIGFTVVLLGAAVITGWHLHWIRVIQLTPDLPPMKYNTAVGFVLAGLSLLSLTKNYFRMALVGGGIITLLGSLTLVEYVWSCNLGIDEIVMKGYVFTATSFPGRMSLLAASSFAIFGAGLLLASVRRQDTVAAAGLVSCVTGIIGGMALVGHLAGMEVATGWGAYTRMAVHTSVGFLLLATGLFIQSWQMSENSRFKLLRWAPITASLTLLAMNSIVAAASLAQLKDAANWRKHTYTVIESAQSFQDDYVARQRNVRGYVTMGDTNLLKDFQRDSNLWPVDIAQLGSLTHDNTSQGVRLKMLTAALDAVNAYDDEMIAAYQKSGSAGVLHLDATGKGRAITGHELESIKAFIDEEKHLLTTRDTKEQTDYRSVVNLFIFGIALCGLLLILANWMASHELTIRRRAEARLQELLSFQQAMLNSADYGIVATEPGGLIRMFNPAAEKLLGYSAAEVVGKETPMLWRDPLEVAERAGKISRQHDRPVKSNFDILVAKVRADKADEGEWTFIRKDGTRFTTLLVVSALADPAGKAAGYLGVFRDITAHKQFEAERETLIMDLRKALAEVKTLSGMIPICGWCKSVRSDQGFWQTVEQYVRAHTDASFTHGICPACQEKFLADAAKTKRA